MKYKIQHPANTQPTTQIPVVSGGQLIQQRPYGSGLHTLPNVTSPEDWMIYTTTQPSSGGGSGGALNRFSSAGAATQQTGAAPALSGSAGAGSGGVSTRSQAAGNTYAQSAGYNSPVASGYPSLTTNYGNFASADRGNVGFGTNANNNQGWLGARGWQSVHNAAYPGSASILAQTVPSTGTYISAVEASQSSHQAAYNTIKTRTAAKQSGTGWYGNAPSSTGIKPTTYLPGKAKPVQHAPSLASHHPTNRLPPGGGTSCPNCGHAGGRNPAQPGHGGARWLR